MCSLHAAQYSGKSLTRWGLYIICTYLNPFFADVLWLLLFVEAFIKIMKPSVSIHEAVSAHLRHFQLCFFIDRIRSIQGRKWNELQNRIETLASCLNVSIFSYLMKIMWGKRQWNHSWKHVPQSNDIADFSNISLTSVIGSLWSVHYLYFALSIS